MKSKLYVGNLSYDLDNSELEQAFGECGTVESANIITDRSTGRSKGFGFIKMKTDEEAAEAVEKFNGRDLKGRALKVSLAKENNR